MQKSDFYYDLPPELIAQTPIKNRDESRLLVLDRSSGEISHRHFYDVADYLGPGDVLVLNDTKVLPCRLYGVKRGTGATVELLLLEDKGSDVWDVIAGPGKKARAGAVFDIAGGKMTAEIIEVLDNGDRLAKLSYDGNFYDVLDEVGEMPLPHYITEKLADRDRYQTVYAKNNGSAAAPTAGLHFTPELLKKLKDKGVEIVYITLHVGIGTFRPVKEDNIEDHKMHFENYTVSSEAAEKINAAKREGRRVIAVGTTCTRTLEASSEENGLVRPGSDRTNIFIYPGYRFRCVDALITNFHLPESTLIMLVSAFCGREKTLEAYKTAVERRYRFFSFGDACLIY
ncbi:MAG: tRNA preQ1(34) S-adenosylmethionine ribosyltransferase-isomerase QueA [Clostridia bacterium]|nr:tRNA preQ1(34) S-adenosylmethionine ribosyltransferase-isomerase QueA [Clostridia bacterium]